MSKPKRSVFVIDTSYPVVEKSGYLKADLGGRQGWTSVWAPTDAEQPYTVLVRRIKQARRGEQ